MISRCMGISDGRVSQVTNQSRTSSSDGVGTRPNRDCCAGDLTTCMVTPGSTGNKKLRSRKGTESIRGATLVGAWAPTQSYGPVGRYASSANGEASGSAYLAPAVRRSALGPISALHHRPAPTAPDSLG